MQCVSISRAFRQTRPVGHPCLTLAPHLPFRHAQRTMTTGKRRTTHLVVHVEPHAEQPWRILRHLPCGHPTAFQQLPWVHPLATCAPRTCGPGRRPRSSSTPARCSRTAARIISSGHRCDKCSIQQSARPYPPVRPEEHITSAGSRPALGDRYPPGSDTTDVRTSIEKWHAIGQFETLCRRRSERMLPAPSLRSHPA
eukprot:2913117-Rhodomonas_salina.2